MIIKMGGVKYRVTCVTGLSKLEMLMNGEWSEVDMKYHLIDLVEAAYRDGKRYARIELADKLGLRSELGE